MKLLEQENTQIVQLHKKDRDTLIEQSIRSLCIVLPYYMIAVTEVLLLHYSNHIKGKIL